MAAKPVSGSGWKKVPCSVWQLSQLSVAWGKRRQGQQQNMVDLNSSNWGTQNTLLAQAIKPHGLNCTQAFVQLGSGTHQAEQASLHLTVVHWLSWIQPEHTMSWFDNSRHARQEWGYMESQSRGDLTSVVSSHQGTLTKEKNVGRYCPELAVFPGVHISMN
jgi:hypothetical protein